MFSITQPLLGPFALLRISDNITGEYIELLPGLGLSLNDLVIKDTAINDLVSVVDGYRSSEEIRFTHHNAFKGSKLSPYPNRIKNGHYLWEGASYQFPLHFREEHNSIHGLVHNRAFALTSQEETEEYGRATFEYNYLGEDQGYPFPFRLEVMIEMRRGSCALSTKISSDGSDAIPFGDGWHPYFQLGGKVDEWSLQLPSCKALQVDDQMIPTGESSDFADFVTSRSIGDLSLDTCFKLAPQNPGEVLQLSRPGVALRFHFDTREGAYDHLQVYIPPHRNTIAIEPMTCPPDVFNRLRACDLLQTGETRALDFKISW